jgi:hypothetical protein
LIELLLIGDFFLVTQRRAYLFAILPFLILPVCLVIHCQRLAFEQQTQTV